MTDQLVLVAGVGNIFLGDDGFGVAVANRIDASTLPKGVVVADYGIRGVHLAYDLLDADYQSLIMIDAVSLGEAPGTLAVMEVHATGPDETTREAPVVDAHSLHPEAVLATLRSLGGSVTRVHVVGCQPADVAEGIGLSDRVSAVLDDAVDLVCALAASEAQAVAHA
jgi:hydrogenase maturation protease